MRFPDPLIPGTLIRRYKRFLADVKLDTGGTVTAHCANPGSMMGLTEPGSEGWVAKLQRNLALRLEQLSGQSVSVHCHRISPEQQEANDALLEHLSEAKTLVSVVSPPFVNSEQCQQSLQQFWDKAAETHNVVNL